VAFGHRDRMANSVTAILADTELCQSMLFLLAFLALGHARRIVQYRLVLTHPAIPVAKF
jgi:hypothetical protein